MGRELAELNEAKLDEASRKLLSAFDAHPARGCANLQMKRWTDGTYTLLVTIPSPTGEERRDLSLWLDENRVPSLQFGGWHTHADLWNPDLNTGLRMMLDYLERIIDGEIVLAEVPTVGDGFPSYQVVDLADYWGVLDKMTSPHVPGNLKLLSWSGTEDTVLDDLANLFI